MKLLRRIFGGDTLKFLIIAMLAAGAGPAVAAVWQWSRTSDNNATADPSINWAEGMSPSSINDSARAMMAQVANYRDDISGLLATAGSSTAYTVATNSVLCQAPASTTTPSDGQLLSVTVHATNGTSPTLQSDSCNAFPIQSAPGQAVASGTLILGTPYNLKFSTANSAWMLKGFYASSTNVQLGALVAYTGSTVPNSNFIFAAGQCISTTTYASYWALLGSPASGSCSGGNFQVIDMAGTIPAGLDTMPGFSAAGRLTSSSNGCGTAMTSVGARCANGNQSQTIVTLNLPAYTPSGSISNGNITVNGSWALVAGLNNNNGGGGGVFSATGAAAGATASQAASTFNGSAQGGSSQPMANVPPVVGVTYLLRVL
jgi:hypothetical protein